MVPVGGGDCADRRPNIFAAERQKEMCPRTKADAVEMPVGRQPSRRAHQLDNNKTKVVAIGTFLKGHAHNRIYSNSAGNFTNTLDLIFRSFSHRSSSSSCHIQLVIVWFDGILLICPISGCSIRLVTNYNIEVTRAVDRVTLEHFSTSLRVDHFIRINKVKFQIANFNLSQDFSYRQCPKSSNSVLR